MHILQKILFPKNMLHWAYKKWHILSEKSGFTLVEIIVAMTILALILTSVFQVYSNIITLSKRLEMARGLQDNARAVTEAIATDIRNGGIAFECYTSAWITNPGCDGGLSLQYAWSGTDTLILRGSWNEMCGISGSCHIQYYLAKKSLGGPIKCTTAAEILNAGWDPETACFLAKRLYDDTASAQIGDIVRLTDAATKINTLRFYISGSDVADMTSKPHEWKVTAVFQLSLAPRQWLDAELAKRLVIPIQTTISQKLYKSQ